MESRIIEDYEKSRDNEIGNLEIERNRLLGEADTRRNNWGIGSYNQWQLETQGINNHYNNFIESRRLDYAFQVLHIQSVMNVYRLYCDDVKNVFDISGSWSINQSNRYSGTLNIQYVSNGTFTGKANFYRNLSGNIVDGVISGKKVTFRIQYSNMYGDYSGALQSDGNTIVNEGTTKSSKGDRASWTATRN